MSRFSDRNNVFTPFTGQATSGSHTSSVLDVLPYTELRTFHRFVGGISGTVVVEGTVRVPINSGPPDVSVNRFPITDWTTINTLTVSQSNSATSQSLLAAATAQPWAYVRARFTPAATGSVTGSLHTFISAKT